MYVRRLLLIERGRRQEVERFEVANPPGTPKDATNMASSGLFQQSMVSLGAPERKSLDADSVRKT
jgi:hypothetical protein